MTYQFVHLEAYSRKPDKGGRSVKWVLDEADRHPEASPHVENLAPPKLVHGCSIGELRQMHDAACQSIRNEIAGGKTRAIRQDQKTLLTVVASHEMTPDEYRTGGAAKQVEYERWEADTINWLRDQHGEDLKTVVRHEDEGRLHIHAYVLPSDLRALDRHPGVAAKRSAKDEASADGVDGKESNKVGDRAYKQAMRDWQDSYFEQVAVRHGLARLGPGKRRLSREGWHQEKAQAQALKRAQDAARRLKADGAAYVARTKERASLTRSRALEVQFDIDRLKADTLEKRKDAKVLHDAATARLNAASKALRDARSEGRRIIDLARSNVERLRAVGTSLRSLWDGLRHSKLESSIRRSLKGEIDAAHRLAEDSRREALEDRRKRRCAEQRQEQLIAAVHTVGRERDAARRELAALHPDTPRSETSFGARG